MLYKRYYQITVTNPMGEVVHTGQEFSGYAVDEEIRLLKQQYRNHNVVAEYKEEVV